MQTHDKNSQYNITVSMDIDDSIQRKTNEFLNLLKPLPNQIKNIKKLAKKQAKDDARVKKMEEKT